MMRGNSASLVLSSVHDSVTYSGLLHGQRGPDGHEGVAELKEELEARGEGKTGNKAWLRRRLHAAIVRKHLDAADA